MRTGRSVKPTKVKRDDDIQQKKKSHMLSFECMLKSAAHKRGGADTMSAQAISCYRQILRASKLIPTELRQIHVRNKARTEFELPRHVDATQQQFLLALADTHIDNIRAQAQHLQHLADTGKLRW